ncbi:hypothetical protein BFJ66_g17846 [Fusarium oxysporum f. sp. cepae]|uniref:TNFR-Cys domain-containing protein n=1 Tax=Fusarium oxysporum f. sp. cepae TaxID=396571 RepID=A0A3L6N2L7_FUSOX|nr:hypothetical protein BFJ65_g14790 [Fusarium oxysporum f. sp. cepae]RKK17199.1 hypothetical protein BFJ67_g17791 [Fusarium oxysporum f. sp. cepae]RKK19076.1 hypothetical protein BFJ66_g17846 [Fusarium oxysporum f. sp. cepae]
MKPSSVFISWLASAAFAQGKVISNCVLCSDSQTTESCFQCAIGYGCSAGTCQGLLNCVDCRAKRGDDCRRCQNLVGSNCHNSFTCAA